MCYYTTEKCKELSTNTDFQICKMQNLKLVVTTLGKKSSNQCYFEMTKLGQ